MNSTCDDVCTTYNVIQSLPSLKESLKELLLQKLLQGLCKVEPLFDKMIKVRHAPHQEDKTTGTAVRSIMQA